MVRGFKVFNPDFTCREFWFEIGKRYTHEGSPVVCGSGFHFCEKLADCYEYYKFNEKNKIAEIIAHGEVLTEGNKSCTNDIEIVKEISWSDCLNIVNTGKNNVGISNTGDSNTGDSNTGDSNTGYRNTGDSNTGDSNTGYRNTGDSNTGDSNTGYRNTGDRNAGDSNTGYRNTGYRNTGDLNKCNYSSGIFCTEEKKALIFDLPSEMTLTDWRQSEFAPLFYNLYLCEWVHESEMSDQEKIDHPKFYVQEGFLKTFTPEEAWQKWFKLKTPEEIKLVKTIPNFDSNKFKFITGIEL